MIFTSLMLNDEAPRLGQGMAEYFLTRSPFARPALRKLGHLTGLPEHGEQLLNDERLVVVFPEGARGAGKLYKDRYKLVRFGTGFMRLALKTGAPVIPCAFIGGEESFPQLFHIKWLAKLVNGPFVPVAPQLIFFPLPVACQVYYGPPMHFEGDGSEPDHVIQQYVEEVRHSMERLISRGLDARPRAFMFERMPDRGEGTQAMKILITGISGTLARGVAYRLVRRGYQVVGIDRRPWPDVPEGVEMHQADIRKRPAEDVFRISRPDALIHMATVTHFTTDTEERYRINLGGTRKLFEYCHEYGVKQAVFVGRHTVYGATPDSPLYHTEDEPPLAGAAFKELADLVAADLYAGSALWRWPELNTAVLRLCYFLGPSRGGTLAELPLEEPRSDGDRLRSSLPTDARVGRRRSDHLGGRETAARRVQRGGPSTGASVDRLFGHRQASGADPRTALPSVLGRFGFPYLPDDAVAHVKYPIVIDNKAFVEATGFEPRYSAKQTMEGFRWN